MRTRGLYENSVIAVMSDHGEALGDHGEDTHGMFLYDETIHVPLVIKLPGGSSAGKRIEHRVGLVDVLPTILQAVGITVPQEVQGETLLGMMKPAPAEKVGAEPAPEISPDRPMYAETDYPYSSFRWSALRSVRTGKYLFIQAPRRELYDEGADPKAEHNLAPVSKAVADTLEGRLDAFRQKTSSSREAPKVSLDLGQQEKLAALGYFAADNASTGGGAKATGADPKDKIEISNVLHRVELLQDGLHYQEAIALLEQVIAKEPDTFIAYRQLGDCYMTLHDFKKAVPVLRKAAELRPDSIKQHFQLGMALLATEDFAAAAPEFEIVVAKVPRWDQAHLMLAVAYAKTDRAREAVTECEKVLEVIPDHYGALLLEGQVLVLSKQAQAALPRLEKAAALQPQMPEPHTFLADAYAQLGRKTDAARERAQATRLGADRKE
jgi:tetratricopeptide (TPR) repeat protein